MKFEKLDYKVKPSRMFLYGFIIAVLLIIIINLFMSRAKYRNTVSVPIVTGTIDYVSYQYKIIEIYKQNENNCTDINNCYTKITDDNIPTGYEVNVTNSYCNKRSDNEKDTGVSITLENDVIKVTNAIKGDKCYVYLDKLKTASDKTLTSLNRTTCDDTPTFTNVDTSEHLKDSKTCLYQAEDDLGTSYYFRGKVKDNWVQFGKTYDDKDIYWRIVRINGDGTIRLIFAGIKGYVLSNDNGYTSTSISNATVNYKDGFFYSNENGDRVYSDAIEDYANGNQSYVAQNVNQWFGSNLNSELNETPSYIDQNSYYCMDISKSNNSSTTWSDAMSNTSSNNNNYYGGYLRLTNSNKQPTLKCSTTDYKLKSTLIYKNSTLANKGAKILQYPVGLLTADEIAFAGGTFNQSNSSYYLYNGKNYWTMSPSYANWSVNKMFYVRSNGSLVYCPIDDSGSTTTYDRGGEYGLRPVINLKSSVEFTGSGLYKDPYVIKPV